jgi:hypothetical protein
MEKEASAGFFLLIGGGERVCGLSLAQQRRSTDGSPVRWNHSVVSGPLLYATDGWASVGFLKSGASPKRYGTHCSRPSPLRIDFLFFQTKTNL